MANRYTPELGQIISGNPPSEYRLPEYAESMVRYVISEYGRVFWNKNQVEWNEGGCYPEGEGELIVPGLEIRHYYWGDEESEGDRIEMAKPNLAYDGVEIRWYKYVGRGVSTNVDWDANKWAEWMDKVLEAIRKEDKLWEEEEEKS